MSTCRLTLALAAVGLAGLSHAAAQAPRFSSIHRMLPLYEAQTSAMAVGDVDADGDLDVLLDGNRLYQNDGDGRFTDVSATHMPGSGSFAAAALGDVDGDGDLDALLGGFLSTDQVYLNDGSGVFTDATATSMPPNAGFGLAISVALSDVDGDGDLDAFLARNTGSSSGRRAELYLNDGNGVFTDATATSLPPYPGLPLTNSAALGDVDGDGDLDVLLVGPSLFAPGNQLYLNDGSGVFTDATAAQLPPGAAESVALGDVDGDGDLDALLGAQGQGALYLNDGSGVFTVTAGQLPPFSGAGIIVLGDVDGDGDLDVLAGKDLLAPLNHRDQLLVNDGNGFFTDASATQLPPGPEWTTAIGLGDVDGDGDLDALTGHSPVQGNPVDVLLMNDGAGVFSDVTVTPRLPPDLDLTQSVALDDVDGDGDLDVLLGNFQQNKLYLNQGNGVYDDASAQLPADADDTRSVALGDVDGDGDDDALLGNDGQNKLYLNDGTGAFIDATAQLPPDADTTESVVLGDVDGDGDPDALLGNVGQNRLYLNDGSGTFADATAQLPSDADATESAVLGDVDGDGDPDALFGNDGQNKLYLNDGTGAFVDATAQLPLDADWTTSVALGDVDVDGDLDALLGGGGGTNLTPDRLFLNDGNGVFADATATNLPAATPTTFTFSVVLGDVDADGDLDALLGANAGPDRLFLNGGNGVFADATAANIPGGPGTRAVALGDIDGDGDDDALLGGVQTNRILTNLTRQVAWRGLPRVGRQLAMDVYGEPGALWALYASPGTTQFSLPFGTWWLNPGSFYRISGGFIGSNRRAAWSTHIADDPGYVGLSLYWQAFVTSPLALTGYEVTTFSGL